MTNYGQNTDNQDSITTGGGGVGDEFIAIDEKKPMNRSIVALILIAAVGGAMVYFMYLRGRFNADTQTPQQKEMAQSVSEFMDSSDSSIRQMELQLAQTEKAVAAFQQSNATGQVPLEKLRTNPFGTDMPQAAANQVAAPAVVNTGDPVQSALSKIKVQMILYSGPSSSANIGNRLVKVGDRVNVDQVQFTVKTITQTSVILSHPTGNYTLLVAQGM